MSFTRKFDSGYQTNPGVLCCQCTAQVTSECFWKSPSLAVSWGARCLASCSCSVSLSLIFFPWIFPCTAMPSPAVQTVSPMSVLGPLHAPRSSVQCTLLVPLCVSDTWIALASFKDCFATCLFNENKEAFLFNLFSREQCQLAVGQWEPTLAEVTPFLAARHLVQLSLFPADGTVWPFCSHPLQVTADFWVSLTSTPGHRS